MYVMCGCTCVCVCLRVRAYARTCVSYRAGNTTKKNMRQARVNNPPYYPEIFIPAPGVRARRSWKRVFHSKRLTIKFPENKTVIPESEKCGSSLKMQLALRSPSLSLSPSCGQTEFNSNIVRQFVINNHPPRRPSVRPSVRISPDTRARGKSSGNQLRGGGSLSALQSNIAAGKFNGSAGSARPRRFDSRLVQENTIIISSRRVPIRNNEHRAPIVQQRRFRRKASPGLERSRFARVPLI